LVAEALIEAEVFDAESLIEAEVFDAELDNLFVASIISSLVACFLVLLVTSS